ncbi:hypothetical protein CTI12_AA460500 [Artemisia annua]|uniref:Protein FAR1-RELATED SEQUENCE n=1 Tax=Artemisia annua TaxID=35608 RepID=A0A2U1LFH7_ARTAN|nr:hypothetical protein CTI12_AA460500 [Artemisia annua]
MGDDDDALSGAKEEKDHSCTILWDCGIKLKAAIALPFPILPLPITYAKLQMTSNDQSTMNQSEEIYLATSKFESNDDLLKSCDLSGVYQDKRRAGTKRKKSTGSRLTDCPFQITGKKGSDGVWVFKVKNLTHNHDPSTDMSGHPSFRRLEPDDVQTVKKMSLSGIPPRQILSTLRQQNPNLPAISRTIYNLKAKFRKDDLGNRSSISLLFEELEKGGFSHDILHNSEGYITVYSTTESVFERNWREFELFYSGKKDAIVYIKDTWFPWKDKFVSAWTEKYLHFGNRSSSRAEGAHAKLKLYLQVSTGSFLDVKKKICLAVEHEFNAIKVKLASEKIRVPHNCNIPLFRELLSHLSQFALKEIYKQYEKIKDGHFMVTMGLPCAHKIVSCLGKTIPLDIIHPHWRIDALSLNPEVDSSSDGNNNFFVLLDELRSKYQMWPLSKQELATSMIAKLVNESNTYFEPVIQRPKGRPSKAKKKKGKTSTTRYPSKFELVESSQAHNPSSSRHVQHHNNLIDLNAYPELGDLS